jgi:hypothetical protein
MYNDLTMEIKNKPDHFKTGGSNERGNSCFRYILSPEMDDSISEILQLN